MEYYVGVLACNSNYLCHHGVLGMKWGVRRYQNKDGSYKKNADGRYSESKREQRKKKYIEKHSARYQQMGLRKKKSRVLPDGVNTTLSSLCKTS